MRAAPLRERLWVPRRHGRYRVEIAATDLAGNSASLSGAVRVLRPKKHRHRRA
jgi:hypothetical protein